MTMTTVFSAVYEAKALAEQVLSAYPGSHVNYTDEGLEVNFEYAPKREEEIAQAQAALRIEFPAIRAKVIRRKNGRWTYLHIPLLRCAHQGRVLSVRNF